MKKLFLAAIALLLFAPVRAQDTTHTRTGCNLDGDYVMSHAVPASHIPASGILPYMFPPHAKDTCGKIIFFYEDVITGSARGFAEGSGIGSTRRATMCAVSQYIQSVFDFSHVPSGFYLRVLISESYSDLRPATSSIRGQLSGAWPYFDASHVTGDTVNGYFHDFVTSGTDPLAGLVRDSSFHGELFVNFDSIWLDHALYASGTEKNFGDVVKVVMNNGPGDPHHCEYDLFSIALHSMGHIMGWLSWDDKHTITTFFTSRMQQSEWMGPDPHGLYDPFAGLTPYTKPSPPSLPYRWANNLKVPENYVFDQFTHHLGMVGGQYTWFNRLSPSDIQSYVMEYATIDGLAKRKYLKGDLRAFTQNVGYEFTPGFLADSAVMLANSIPWSSKMSNRFNHNLDVETMPADYTMTNDISSSLTIHLAADTSLKDNDGDSVRIYPGSLVNFRGCGSGGNNHALLSVNAGGTTIIYTPRPGFYGRAQFGYNSWDGKEKGAFILTTIDVEKGTNVSVPPGGNFIQNGDVEEGEQVKIKGTDEGVNNTLGYFSEYTPSRWGGHYIDGQYYPAPAVIHNSYSECGFTTAYTFGSLYHSFPWPTPDSTVQLTFLAAMKAKNPAPNKSEGERYINKKSASFHLLNDTIRNCRRYRFEFDMARIEDTAGGDKDTVFLGLTAKNMITDPSVAHLLQTYRPQAIAGLRYDHWEHYSIPFTYCNDTPATVLYLRTAFAHMMDNLSIVELPDTMSLEVTAFADELEGCRKRLYTNSNMGCPMSYTWEKLDGTFVGADTAVEVDASALNTYIVTVTDGCGHTGKDTIEVSGCPCSPGDVFGAAATTLSGTAVTGTFSSGNYYIPANITITGATSFTGAKVLIEQGVLVTVAATAKLTLDSCHLFTCPDSFKMWQGIVLASSGSNSGRIEVRNNSMIEDAFYAINANLVKAPPSGDLIKSTNSIYNRNWISINISNGYSLGGAGTYPITLTGNIFTARDFNKTNVSGYPLKWPGESALRNTTTVTDATPSYVISKDYPRAYCKDGQMSYLGVQLDNIGTTYVPGSSYSEVLIGGAFSVSQANVFDNHRYGLHSYNSNTSVRNNIFINIGKRISPSSAAASVSLPDYGGIGAVAQSTPASPNNRFQVVPAVGNAGNVFHDCFFGIYTDGIGDLEASNCIVKSSHRIGSPAIGAAYPTEIEAGIGIISSNRNYLKYNVSSNYIANMNIGIYAAFGSPRTGATAVINGNRFKGADTGIAVGLTGKQYIKHAIRTEALTYSGPTVTLDINENKMAKVFNGIQAYNFQNIRVGIKGNIISLWDTVTSLSSLQNGITHWWNYGTSTAENIISTPSLSAANIADRITGVYTAFGVDNKVCGNTTTNMGRGFEFAMTTPQTGTRWIGNTMNNGYKGFILGSDIGDQGFMYNWLTVSPRTFYGAIRDKFNISGGGKFQTYVERGIRSMNSKLYVKNGMTPPELPTSNFTISPTNEYKFVGTTGSILLATTTQWDANCDGAIYPQVSNPPRPGFGGGGIITLGRLIMADSLGYDSSFYANQWMAQLSLYQLGINEPTLRDSVGLFDTFMTVTANSRYAWIMKVQAALDTADTLAVQNLLANYPSAAGRVQVNNKLVITDYSAVNYIMANYRVYFDTYLRYLKGTMTGADSSNVGALTLKCPARDGAVVYQARTFYNLLTRSFRDYNDDGCGTTGYSTLYRVIKEQEPLNDVIGQSYTLFPNPNEGRFSIRQQFTSDELVDVKVYNATGMLVGKEMQQFINGILNFRMTNPVPGLYLICLTDKNQKTICLKFNIE